MITLLGASNPAASATAATAKSRETARAGRGGPALGAQCAAGEDCGELSAAVGSLRTVLEGEASSRAGRVEALRVTFQAGDYAADPAAISRGMVNEALAEEGPA